MAFGRMAASVFSVSTSDSPFETLEPEAVMETGVGAQALGGDLEAGAGARRGFEKQVDDHLPAQRIQALERLILQWLKIFSAGQNRFDFSPLQLFDAEQSRHQAPVPAVLSTSSTFSISSIS